MSLTTLFKPVGLDNPGLSPEELFTAKPHIDAIDALINEHIGTMSQEAWLDLDISEEKFKVANFFRGLGQIFYSITANTFNAFLLQRGKLTEFKQFNIQSKLKISKVESIATEQYANMVVDYPTGMIGSYLEVIKMITAANGFIDVPGELAKAQSAINQVTKSLAREQGDYSDMILNIEKECTAHVRNWVKANTKLTKSFQGKSKGRDKQPFTSLIGSVADLKSIRLNVLDQASYIAAVRTIAKDSQKLSDTTKAAVDMVEVGMKAGGEHVPTKQFILAFAEYIKSLALMLEVKGQVANYQMVIEHNLGLVYTSLYDRAKGL